MPVVPWPQGLRLLGVLFVVLVLAKSIKWIGPTQVGLVSKRFALRKLPGDNPIAFRGERATRRAC